MEPLKDYLIKTWENLSSLLRSIGITDVVDIVVVSVIFFYIFKFIRDRRAGRLAVGVGILLVLQLVSDLFELTALKFLMENVLQVGLLALIIVFQPELRSVLEQVGVESIKGLKSIGAQKDAQSASTSINNICEAVCDLAAEKTGALIVLERSTKLGDVIKSGTVVNADVNPFLLKNIFFNKAPLHDGAVVIRDERICAAGCFLPLSANDAIIKDLGTRHRAAIGMSENSDAVVVVVSEETGVISIAIGGQLKRHYNYSTLRHELRELFVAEHDAKPDVKSVFKGRGKKSGKL